MKLYRTTYGQGPDLLILHGIFGAGGNWATLARKEYGPHYRTWVPDLRNHGRSPHDPGFSFPEMVDDLLELMDDEGMESGTYPWAFHGWQVGHASSSRTS